MSAGQDDDPSSAGGDEPTGEAHGADQSGIEPGPASDSSQAGEHSADTSHDTGARSVFAEPPHEPPSPIDRTDDRPAPSRPTEPLLPSAPGKAPPPMVDPLAHPRPGSSTWYRTDEDRNRSVYRLANPWYRRIARAAIGLCFLGAAGIGIYFGARAVQNYLDRDKLPEQAADVPEIRSTTFLITGEDPAPELDGTLTLDAVSGAFEFVGRASGPQSGLQVVSADGSTAYIREGTAAWRVATGTDTTTTAVRTAVRYLSDDDNADDILTHQVRRGFVELIDQIDEGVGDDALTRYELEIDTRKLAIEFPLQWQDFQNSAIPGAAESTVLPVTIWIDRDDVLVRVRDTESNWAWERLAYSDQSFVVESPTDEVRVVQVACVTGEVFWQSPLSSCDTAYEVGRELALTTGVAEGLDDPAADLAIAELCSAMERESGPLPESDERIALAETLVEQGVCLGDPDVFVPDG